VPNFRHPAEQSTKNLHCRHFSGCGFFLENYGLLYPDLAHGLAGAVAAHILAEVEDGLRVDCPACLLAGAVAAHIPAEMGVAHILAEVEVGPRVDGPAYLLPNGPAYLLPNGPAYLLPNGPAYLLVDDLVARIPVEMVAAHTLVASEGIPRVDGPPYLLAAGLVVRILAEVVDSLLTSDVVCPQISHRDLLHERHQSPDTEQ